MITYPVWDVTDVEMVLRDRRVLRVEKRGRLMWRWSVHQPALAGFDELDCGWANTMAEAQSQSMRAVGL